MCERVGQLDKDWDEKRLREAGNFKLFLFPLEEPGSGKGLVIIE